MFIIAAGLLTAMSPPPDGGSSVSTGDRTLDTMLDGGLPKNRSVLVAGGPGTGKSTLAMQFLQVGLDAGEECLYISTEQTIDELREAFSDFEFDLDHENLTYTSIHATPGRTIESDEEELTLQTLEGGESLGEGFNTPFTAEYIQEYLQRHAPQDRVVFDSVSGLGVMADNQQFLRRTTLDMIRFFSDEFGATTVFTAEDHGNADGIDDVLKFTTHGVIELSRRQVADDPHRFLSISKMRGVDHDRREVELEFDPSGVRIAPYRRSQPPALKTHHHQPIGIEGLDALTGGGLVTGAGVLLSHDGRANLMALYALLLKRALDSEFDLLLNPSIELRQGRVEQLLANDDQSLDAILEEDRLSVIDTVGGWDHTRQNVHEAPKAVDDIKQLLADIDDRSDRPLFGVIDADAIVHALGEEGARELRNFHEAHILGQEDSLLYTTNPSVVGDRIGAFYADAAEQVIRTWIADNGLQYISLTKSPCGFVGSTSLVEYIQEPPYLRVQHPPQARENPFADPS
jgi:KaiC/GvpD/RAD55 family RecA-like ATPase